ncbi:UPF0283 membrane protein PM0909 [Frankliniella fusca]|uniref:UPF0283 membrane protein PM0909 n=1 Tax=Frankliniella fusca TaxID=407009 RepID=A0AAE1GSV4_9NEOP|nr:UPF0283 membrane protein PM0909 [Frankliniella fusca]
MTTEVQLDGGRETKIYKITSPSRQAHAEAQAGGAAERAVAVLLQTLTLQDRLLHSMTAAMLAPLLTLALLPLALAACPCPPAPAAAEVCGSDHKTYPSACDLDCTAPPGQCAPPPPRRLKGTSTGQLCVTRRHARAPPGVAAAHPGPCRPADAALGRPTNATLLLSGRRGRRSATEEREKYWECGRERQCDSVTCSECGERDWACAVMCEINCRCGCVGVQSRGLDWDRYSECRRGRECWDQVQACRRRCSTEECRDGCRMHHERCLCGCAQQAEGTTTPRPASRQQPRQPRQQHNRPC